MSSSMTGPLSEFLGQVGLLANLMIKRFFPSSSEMIDQ